jgi:hypothetical protein
MAEHERDFVLPDVPPFNPGEHPDLFLEALSIAASYGNDTLKARFRRRGVYAHLSGYTGRGWLIGFDDACYYWEKHGIRNPHPAFAVSGLESNLEHHETLREAITYLGYTPEFLWNAECRYGVDARLAAPFVGAAEAVDGLAIRRYVTDYLTTRRRPAVCFLHFADTPIVDAALLTGFESGGEMILGRSAYQDTTRDSSAGYGYFSLADWERDVVAIVGLGEEVPIVQKCHPCYTAIENALRYSVSHTRGTKARGRRGADHPRLDVGRVAGRGRVLARRQIRGYRIPHTMGKRRGNSPIPRPRRQRTGRGGDPEGEANRRTGDSSTAGSESGLG